MKFISKIQLLFLIPLLILSMSSHAIFGQSSRQHHESFEGQKKAAELSVIANKTVAIKVRVYQFSTLENEIEKRTYSCKNGMKSVLRAENINKWNRFYNAFNGCLEYSKACSKNGPVGCKEMKIVHDKTVDAKMEIKVRENFKYDLLIKFASPITNEKVSISIVNKNLSGSSQNVQKITKFKFYNKVTSVSEGTITYNILGISVNYQIFYEHDENVDLPAPVEKILFKNEDKIIDLAVKKNFVESENRKFLDLSSNLDQLSQMKDKIAKLVGVGEENSFALTKMHEIESALEEFWGIASDKEFINQNKLLDPVLKKHVRKRKSLLRLSNLLCGEKKWYNYILGVGSKQILDLRDNMMRSADLANIEGSVEYALKSYLLFEKFREISASLPDIISKLSIRYMGVSEFKNLIDTNNCGMNFTELMPIQTYDEFFEWNLMVYEVRYGSDYMRSFAGIKDEAKKKTAPWED